MKIKLINFGIASRIGDIIYINKEIKKNKKLYEAILNHESEHTNSFKLKDIILDLNGTHLKDVKKEYWKFVLKNPKSWIQFLPMWKYDKRLTIDPLISLVWIWIIFLVFMIWWII